MLFKQSSNLSVLQVFPSASATSSVKFCDCDVDLVTGLVIWKGLLSVSSYQNFRNPRSLFDRPKEYLFLPFFMLLLAEFMLRLGSSADFSEISLNLDCKFAIL
ncbi:hypothetical protein WICPIJ_004507 [Wickerhamomyces pijperi]|uniref:Uncharacterized protein n=1 Tax=Wickerhamomyces pijperi TaxID=599730 RepID=A0A9P8Q7V5_WICPI|nr:hypothetical protein WICPIJ_004507 [Wickerhamomyces pijperi]